MPTALTLAFRATQSSDGKTVLIEDLTNWDDDTEGYTPADFVREFVLTDYLGALITTLIMADDELSATWDVPAGTNPWVNIEYSAVGPVTLSLTQKYPFQRNYELAYIDQIKGSCGCCNGKTPDMCMVDAFYQGAAFAVPVADMVNYQDDINSAYALLTA